MIAMPTTTGTNLPATISANFWIGARERWALATISTIWLRTVSPPTRLASITSEPVPLMVAPVTVSPLVFSTGMDSPDIMDSSIEDRPSTTTPSTGILSPGRMRSLSPTTTASISISSSVPSGRMTVAVLAARSSSARIAEPVCSRARISRICPSRTRTTITAPASK